MERYVVEVSTGVEAKDDPSTLCASSSLLTRLDLRDGDRCELCMGLAREPVTFRADPTLADQRLMLSSHLANQLHLQCPLTLTIYRRSPAQVVLGPVVGLLISSAKLEAVLNGRKDNVYCRYASAARDGGATLLFFSSDRADFTRRSVAGYQHECDPSGECRWTPTQMVLPRVIYDRSFGKPGRASAADFRRLAGELGAVVLNQPVKVTKMQAFSLLQPYAELAPHLPFTAPLTPESLRTGLDRFSDLYLKPDALYKGQGIYRLTRRADGWALQAREEQGNRTELIQRSEDLPGLLTEILDPALAYVIQEGLPLATYLGNRFDLRSLVQKDGSGNWQMSGLVARVAPEQSAITSPRSGGQIAPPDQTLRHAFGERAAAVRQEIERVSLAIAERMDQSIGPCAELGLDLGVLEDGTVKLIEVNGIPLRVSLERLRDPRVAEQIDRFPIHFAAYLDMWG